MTKFFNIFVLMVAAYFSVMAAAHSELPVTTDSRIKTFVYNENEVYKLVIHYGYQSNIELGVGEEIETLSLGESYAWKITPVGRRIFIKSLEQNAHTNMTIITNRHTYQFDLFSKLPDAHIDEELVYVVRFFYPGQAFTPNILSRQDAGPAMQPPMMTMPMAAPASTFPPSAAGPAPMPGAPVSVR